MSESTYYRRTIRLEHRTVKYSIRFAGKYSGMLKEDIRQFKFHGRKDLGRVFGKHIYENLPENYDFSDYDYLLPVPSKSSSLAERGYDHVLLIGERLSELCGLPLVKNILKALERQAQVNLSGNERRDNIKGGFHLIDPSRVAGKSFLVLDDVCATGSTLNEVMRTLITAAPGQLDALVLAKTMAPWE